MEIAPDHQCAEMNVKAARVHNGEKPRACTTSCTMGEKDIVQVHSSHCSLNIFVIFPIWLVFDSSMRRILQMSYVLIMFNTFTKYSVQMAPVFLQCAA